MHWTNDGNYTRTGSSSRRLPPTPSSAERRHRKLSVEAVNGLAVRGRTGHFRRRGIALLIGGLLAAELFVTRVSLLITLAGIVIFLYGWTHIRILAFPLLFLLLMIPLPAIIFNQIAFPLQLLASRVGQFAISSAHIPVLREGNVLILANTSLEVAEACSGIRSLVSLITLGIVYGYFADSRLWVRLVVVASTIPVAIISNGARVAGTGIAAHYMGPEAAAGLAQHELLRVGRVLCWRSP